MISVKDLCDVMIVLYLIPAHVKTCILFQALYWLIPVFLLVLFCPNRLPTQTVCCQRKMDHKRKNIMGSIV